MIFLALVAVLGLGGVVALLMLNARVDRLSRALDRDLLEHSRETFPRPPLPGYEEDGLAFEFYESAFAVTPPEPTDWRDLIKLTRTNGSVPAAALPLLEEAQDALRLVERGAHTRASGLWDDPEGVLSSAGDRVPGLCRLASLDAIRLLGEGKFGAAVDRCLAAVRMAEDQRRYWSPFMSPFVAGGPLRTLVEMADRLPPEEIDRAVDILALEASIPDFRPLARLFSLYLQCSFRRALAGVDDDLSRWGTIEARDAGGGRSWGITRGIRRYYRSKTCMARVRSRVPDAWELLREETAKTLARGSPSATFVRGCNRSENPAIGRIGFLEQDCRWHRERARVEIEATILAILAIRFQQTEGRLPGSLEEIRPPSVRSSPHGSRWHLRSYPESGRPGIWLVPFGQGYCIQGL